MSTPFINQVSFLKSLKKGESKAYTYLVDTYHHKLCLYAFSLTNDHDLSQDIVQNVFIRIWRIRQKLGDNFNFKSYLYKSVYNEFIDVYRKKKNILSLEKKHIDALSFIVTEENEKSLERLIDFVKKEIENLPPKCQQIFLLSKREGLTNAEIAEYLNISTKSVEGHITTAFSKLRKTMSNKIKGLLFLLFGVKIKKSF